jgi:hypothetical protein
MVLREIVLGLTVAALVATVLQIARYAMEFDRALNHSNAFPALRTDRLRQAQRHETMIICSIIVTVLLAGWYENLR